MQTTSSYKVPIRPKKVSVCICLVKSTKSMNLAWHAFCQLVKPNPSFGSQLSI